MAKAKDYADETIRKYTKWAESDAHIREMEAERTKLREQINSKQSHSLKPAKPKKASGLKAKDLFIGADVRILSLNSAERSAHCLTIKAIFLYKPDCCAQK